MVTARNEGSRREYALSRNSHRTELVTNAARTPASPRPERSCAAGREQSEGTFRARHATTSLTSPTPALIPPVFAIRSGFSRRHLSEAELGHNAHIAWSRIALALPFDAEPFRQLPVL